MSPRAAVTVPELWVAVPWLVRCGDERCGAWQHVRQGHARGHRRALVRDGERVAQVAPHGDRAGIDGIGQGEIDRCTHPWAQGVAERRGAIGGAGRRRREVRLARRGRDRGREAGAARGACHRRHARHEALTLLLPDGVVRRTGEKLDRERVARGLVLQRPLRGDTVIVIDRRRRQDGSRDPRVGAAVHKDPAQRIAEDRVLADQVARPLGDLDRVIRIIGDEVARAGSGPTDRVGAARDLHGGPAARPGAVGERHRACHVGAEGNCPRPACPSTPAIPGR